MEVDPGVETDGPSEEIMEDKPSSFLPPPPHPELSFAADTINLVRDPSFEDMFVSFATIPTYVAYR